MSARSRRARMGRARPPDRIPLTRPLVEEGEAVRWEGLQIGRGRAIDPQASGEWWKTLELGPREWGQLYFVDQSTAELFADYLIAEGAEAVTVEHWCDGRRTDMSIRSR
ncbi:MAG: hypothetical protein AB7V62_03420 [Thermoleophilia bacterium]